MNAIGYTSVAQQYSEPRCYRSSMRDPGLPERSGIDGGLSLSRWTKKVTERPTIPVGSIGVTKAIQGSR
ncbi:hypothetical protein A5713_25575 [Mycobacterium sp. E2497]|nr:hypothetical protein A5713_25575 [Mycobacterium sp. E2497]